MKAKKYILTFIAFTFYLVSATAQTNDDVLNLLIKNGAISQADADSLRADNAIKEQETPKDKSFIIGAELRTRTEYRDGYRNLVPKGDTTVPAFFTNQRTRLLLTYEQKNRFILHTSVQDVRVWGQSDARSNNATIQIFEAFAEAFINPRFSIKVGRQKIALDNQRLFAENDWRVNGASADAANFRLHFDKLTSELIFAWNQTSSNNASPNQPNGEPIFGTNYKPGFTFFKSIAVHYLKYKISDKFTLTTLNTADGYQSPKTKEGMFYRYTLGGRLEFETGKWYATVNSYYQSGKNATGKNINAWYVQPEVRYSIPQNLTVRLGAEIWSGDDAEKLDASDHNFVPLYGVAHRFNGNMDFFTNFPGDLNNAGIVNPYLFIAKNVSKQVQVRADFHLFYSQNNFVKKEKVGSKTVSTTIPKYLGYENDLGFIYTPKPYFKVDFGFSYAIAEEAMAVIKKGGNIHHTPTWAYVSLTFKPQLFKATFK